MSRLFKILKELRLAVPGLFLEFIQRHFLYQRKGIRDAFLEFHIDTFGAPFLDDKSKVKEFPIWFQALKEAILNKRMINAQTMYLIFAGQAGEQSIEARYERVCEF